MKQRPPAWLAPARAALLAALITVLTATGHVAAGGSLLGLVPMVVLVPMLATVLVAVADRCRGIVGVLTALAAGQAALHYLLVILTPHAPLAGPVSGWGMVLGHAVATVIIAVVLRNAETAVLSLVAALLRVLPRRSPAVGVAVEPPVRAVPSADVPLRAALVAVAACVRRGPPISC